MNALKARSRELIEAYYTPKAGSNITADDVFNSFMKLVESAERVITDDENIRQLARDNVKFVPNPAAGNFGNAVIDYLKK